MLSQCAIVCCIVIGIIFPVITAAFLYVIFMFINCIFVTSEIQYNLCLSAYCFEIIGSMQLLQVRYITHRDGSRYFR